MPNTETSNKEKVYNLYIELKEAKNDKKVANKAHNENIKRIEGEIDDLVDEEVEDVKKSQKTVDEE
jgi:hypothetical protein